MSLRLLVSAYACEPEAGSEPGVGWGMVSELAKSHDVWVVTRANNRPSIERVSARNERLHFAYFDYPGWASFWKRGNRGIQLYYYLWQLGARRLALELHRHVRFHLAHHLTFAKYSVPSFLAFLPIPFVWGPVGGGETMSARFLPTLGLRGLRYEYARSTARSLCHVDPLVRLTARKAAVGLASTPETARRLQRLGVRQVAEYTQLGLSAAEVRSLAALPLPPPAPVRFVSVGRLIHWKGFHLGLQAFAESGLGDAQYWLIGDGPERQRLARSARSLGVADRVQFFGHLPRTRLLRLLSACTVLVHPSLHESGGGVCLEAMAAGRPVICLNHGGPGRLIDETVGIRVDVTTPDRTRGELAQAMRALAVDPERRQRLACAAQARARNNYTWDAKTRFLHTVYQQIVAEDVRCDQSA